MCKTVFLVDKQGFAYSVTTEPCVNLRNDIIRRIRVFETRSRVVLDSLSQGVSRHKIKMLLRRILPTRFSLDRHTRIVGLR